MPKAVFPTCPKCANSELDCICPVESLDHKEYQKKNYAKVLQYNRNYKKTKKELLKSIFNALDGT